MKHLIFLILANVIGLCYSWEFVKHIWFEDSSIQCHESQCNISLSIRAETDHDWSPIMIMVKMGHTGKIDDGKLAIYDVDNNTKIPRIYGNKNKFSGSIQDFGPYVQKSLACNMGSNCAIEMCIKRGRSSILKSYHPDGTQNGIWVTWSPLITFTELWFGPRFDFKYHIANGVVSRLEVEDVVHYWSECHKEAWDDGHHYPHTVKPNYS